MASCCQILDGSFDSNVAGIMAIFRGISFCNDCGMKPCVLESDKVVAVERVLNNNFLNASCGSILSDIADLRSQVMVLKVCAIPFPANRVANRLAMFALDTSASSFWMEDSPACIRGLIEAEMPS
ncbi:hypothetical protein LWI29_013897 [Acer saccharum]|uniref:RNase H type-1 domain-containing protein n=1 Tax=Acer saccharum TaxID=4024 RepID=A0AA39RR76_ACESA|nr:hypothetical protein LWI29_013897 [Acer saccharum]